MGEGLGFWDLVCCVVVALVDAPPFGRVSRLWLNGSGPLISRIVGGCPFGLRVLSLGGEMRAATFDEDEEGRAKG